MNEFAEKLLRKYRVPEHILRHSYKVAAVAVYLGRKLKERGHNVDLEILYKASILHDLLRVCDIYDWRPDSFNQNISDADLKIWNEIRLKYRNVHHADACFELLKSLDKDEIAEIIKKHKFISIADTETAPKSLEEKILFYADKRVDHDMIVSLKKRFIEGEKRHSQEAEKHKKIGEIAKSKTFELEEELMSMAGIRETDINEKTVTGRDLSL